MLFFSLHSTFASPKSEKKFYDDNGHLIVVSEFLLDSDEVRERHYRVDGTIEKILIFKNGLQNGLESHFYVSGKIKSTIPYENGKKNGRMESWYPSGNYLGFANFKDDHHDQISRAWHDNGLPRAIAKFKNGKQNIRKYKNCG